MVVHTDDGYPSLLWITIPSVFLVSAYFVRRWYLARKLRVHGIGKGAPGFQTNVRRVRVTPEIAARLQRGENVSPEEITRAIEEAERKAANSPSTLLPPTSKASPILTNDPANEWLPDNLKQPKKKLRARKH